MRTVTVLGSTGSIGTQTLDVAARRGWRIEALVAGRNVERLAEQAQAHTPKTVVCDAGVAERLRPLLPPGVRLRTGPQAACDAAAAEVDTVVAAIPGIAGLAPVRAALTAGRHVALATKEAMVVAGALVNDLARRHGGRITPVDSEHAGLDQLLLGERRETVEQLILTASGGPFRDGPVDLRGVTKEQALNHPNWSMGRKVTIDSATLFNKGLEVLEAQQLFDMPLDRIEVVVHPQSLVHALVRFRDGSIKAQVGPHDMRLPILWGVEGDARPSLALPPLPLTGEWTFHPPDLRRFPALKLAYDAGVRGGTAPAVLNAADEIAVAAFLTDRIPFTGIAELLDHALQTIEPEEATWESVALADSTTRALLRRHLDQAPA